MMNPMIPKSKIYKNTLGVNKRDLINTYVHLYRYFFVVRAYFSSSPLKATSNIIDGGPL